jgi:hypothetical protein
MPPSHSRRYKALSNFVNRIPNAAKEAEHMRLLHLLWGVIRKGATPATVRSDFETRLHDEEKYGKEAPTFIEFTAGFLRSYGMAAGDATSHEDRACRELLEDLGKIYREWSLARPAVGAGQGDATATGWSFLPHNLLKFDNSCTRSLAKRHSYHQPVVGARSGSTDP